jgi:hypothetical protein
MPDKLAAESLPRVGRFMRQTAAFLGRLATGGDFFSRDIAMAKQSTAELASMASISVTF